MCSIASQGQLSTKLGKLMLAVCSVRVIGETTTKSGARVLLLDDKC